MEPRRLAARAYPLTFLTGAAGLIYQIVWQRYLARLVGGDALATATVLGVFLGGLSLGFVLWGRWTVRGERPLLLYGALEGLVGLWGLAFPWLFAGVDAATASWSFAPQVGLVVQGTLCAVALIGVPTVCMGATVPVLTRALSESLDRACAVNARVYAFNTLGAVVGTLATGFVLVGWLGLPGTVRFAGLLNLAAAVVFVRLGMRAAPAPRRAEALASDVVPGRRALYAIGLAGGCAFMTLEPLVVRLAGLSIGSSTYSLSLVVAAFLTCIAAGAFVAARRPRRSPSALLTNQTVACLALMPLYATLDLWPYAAHLLRLRFGHGDLDFVAFHAAVFAALCLVLALPVGCMGAMLPLAFDALKRDVAEVGRAAGTLFAWNALGNLLGSSIGGFLAYRFLTLGQLFLLALALVAATVVLAARHQGARSRRVALVTALATLAFIRLFPAPDPARFAVGTFRLREPLPTSRAGPSGFYDAFHAGRTIVAYADDPEATVAVVENQRLADALRQRFPSLGRAIVAVPSAFGDEGPRPRSIVIDGKADSSTFYDRETLRLLAHLPALFAAHRERALVVGLGTGVTAGELTLYPDLRTIDVAEISPAVARMLPLFGEWTHAVHDDPRLRLHRGDALRLLRRSSERWDVVVSQPSNPWTSGSDRLFSREFYALVRQRLAPDGLFASWMQRYATNESISALGLNALRSEFPHVRAFRCGSDDVLLASLRPIEAEAVARAGSLLHDNARVARSLAEIRITSPADLLAREHPEVVERAGALRALGVETLDRPRIHALAGLAFFRGDDPDAGADGDAPRD